MQKRPKIPELSTFGKLQTIVIDNTINTGYTMEQVLAILRNKQIPVDLVVKMIDYQDDEEERINDSIEKQSGIKVKSLFTYEEVGAAFRL